MKYSFLVGLFLPVVLLGQNNIKDTKSGIKQNNVTVITTAKNTDLKLTTTKQINFALLLQPNEGQLCVFVYPNKLNQTFVGIGAAITDASAEVFAKLTADKQQEFLDAYFNAKKGIGYSVIRTNIHSCDFSSDMYTYVNEGDSNLNSFNINHDKQYKLPLIKKAIAIGKNVQV